MDVSTIINLSRKQTSTTAWQIADADYLTYLNIIYKDIFSRLSVNAKKYTWQSYTTDVVAWQQEYIIPQPSDTQTWLKLVLDCFYIHEWKDKRIPIYDASINIDYEINKNKKPYWVLRDGSIFIYPVPEEDIEWGLRLEWKYIPLDLTLTDTQEDIKLAPEYHNILVKGLNSLVFGEKQVFDKQQLREGYYLQAIQQMQTEWSFENESFYHVEDPYLWFLE
jgi:hypothetical protein